MGFWVIRPERRPSSEDRHVTSSRTPLPSGSASACHKTGINIRAEEREAKSTVD